MCIKYYDIIISGHKNFFSDKLLHQIAISCCQRSFDRDTIKSITHVIMFDFIPRIFRDVFKVLKPYLSTDSFKKLFGFFTSWYTYMIGAGLYVVYKLFAALEKAGILDGFKNTVVNAMGSVYYIADTCFEKIGHFQSMIDCIKNS